MVRLLLCFLVQDRGGFELLSVVLVVKIDRAIERERVEDRRLSIVGVVLMQALHRLLVTFGAGRVVYLIVIRVEDLDRGEVLGLARRLRLRGFALLYRLRAGLQVGSREGWHERIGQLARRHAPIGHGAVWVLLDDGLKGLHRLWVEEIVQ
jgi:hypothetical protein